MKTRSRIAAVTPAVLLAALTLTPQAHAATHQISDEGGLAWALANARPGDTIELQPRTYYGAFTATAPGPITLKGARGNRDGVRLQTGSTAKGSGTALTIAASNWTVRDLTVENSNKGLVLDNAQNTLVQAITVWNIGDEGVHIQRCSSNNELSDSYIQYTGQAQPGFGEGVYVGSSDSRMSSQPAFRCNSGLDQSNGNRILRNVIRDARAEGIDLKEGTYGGTVSGNLLERTGTSGQTSADSAIDVKGNYWWVTGNTFGQPQGAQDAIQTHRISGYSNDGNHFHGNTVWDVWNGWGINITNNSGNNVVDCSSNSTPHMSWKRVSNRC